MSKQRRKKRISPSNDPDFQCYIIGNKKSTNQLPTLNPTTPARQHILTSTTISPQIVEDSTSAPQTTDDTVSDVSVVDSNNNNQSASFHMTDAGIASDGADQLASVSITTVTDSVGANIYPYPTRFSHPHLPQPLLIYIE